VSDRDVDYLDFELSLWDEAGRYYAKVTDSPAGQSPRVALNTLVAAETLRLKIENALLRSTARIRGPLSPQEKILRDFGKSFYDIIFRQAEPIKRQYERSLAAVDAQRANGVSGLRVKLRIDAPELAQLPWEYLYDTIEEEWLGLQYRSPIVRFLDVGKPMQDLAVSGRLNVLGMIADPRGDWPPLDTKTERERIDAALKPLCDQGKVNFCWVPGQSAEALVDMMSKGPWHVFHFIGHGGIWPAAEIEEAQDEAQPEGFIVLLDEQGQPQEIAASDLREHLHGPYGMPRLVVLNCCEGARELGSSFSSPACALVKSGVPAVVAMQFPISDEAAVKFAEAFYNCLVANSPIEAALTHARKKVQLKSRIEWGIPVLYTRSPTGRLFARAAEPTENAAPSPPVVPPAALSEAERARARLRELFRTSGSDDYLGTPGGQHA
jgi:hypothetical protein